MTPQHRWTFFFFIYLFIWKAVKERDVSSDCWLTLQMTTMARCKPIWSKKPRSLLRSPTWVAGTQALVSSMAAFPGTFKSELNQKWDSTQHLYGMSALQEGACLTHCITMLAPTWMKAEDTMLREASSHKNETEWNPAYMQLLEKGNTDSGTQVAREVRSVGRCEWV